MSHHSPIAQTDAPKVALAGSLSELYDQLGNLSRCWSTLAGHDIADGGQLYPWPSIDLFERTCRNLVQVGLGPDAVWLSRACRDIMEGFDAVARQLVCDNAATDEDRAALLAAFNVPRSFRDKPLEIREILQERFGVDLKLVAFAPYAAYIGKVIEVAEQVKRLRDIVTAQLPVAKTADPDSARNETSAPPSTTLAFGEHWPDITLEVEQDGDRVRVSANDAEAVTVIYSKLGITRGGWEFLQALVRGNGDISAYLQIPG